MVRLYIILGIWAVLFTFIICGLFYFKSLNNDILSYIEIASNSEDKNEMIEYSDKIVDEWENKSKLIRIFTRHNEIDQMSTLCASIKPLAENGDVGEFQSQLSQIRSLLIHIYESELPLPINIF